MVCRVFNIDASMNGIFKGVYVYINDSYPLAICVYGECQYLYLAIFIHLKVEKNSYIVNLKYFTYFIVFQINTT